MSNKEKILANQLKAFKKKYFFNLLIRGAIISLASMLVLFLFFNYLEYSFQFGINVRTALFFAYIIIALSLLFVFVLKPGTYLVKLDTAMNDESAARQIGSYFPEISDKLLNIIQLRNSNASVQLVTAGINQKIDTLPTVRFDNAVSLKENQKLLPWLTVPFVLIVLIIFFKPEVITKSTERITNFNVEYIPQAPFEFVINNQNFTAFRNEDFTLDLTLEGNNLPQTSYLLVDGRKQKMQGFEAGHYNYTFSKIQTSKTIQFEAAGFKSKSFELNIVNRPDLRSFNMYLQFPSYVNKKNERLSNVGNAQVPEGTKIKWDLNAQNSDSAHMIFESANDTILLQQTDNQIFNFEREVSKTDEYQIKLYNAYSINKDPIAYQIEVIADQYPKIVSNVFEDTITYQSIRLGGNLSDDYGITRLALYYKLKNNEFKIVNIPINDQLNIQRFYYNWEIDSLIKQGEELTYYLQVWDNDGVNGRKSTKTGNYTFKMPTKEELKSEIDKTTQQTENKIDKTLNDAKDLKKQLDETEERLKGKKELNWQDEKQLKDLIKQRENINKALEELKELNKANENKKGRFSPQDEKIKAKVEQLQNLMDQLLDEETKKLYEELKKLLEENSQVDDVQQMLDKINNNEKNLEQELERTLELFKRMKVEYELNEALKELKEQTEQQEKLLEETENNKENESQLADNQEELQNKFDELQEDLKELKEDNQELKNPESLPDTEEEEKGIEQNQQESKELLKEGKEKKATEKQKQAVQQMKKMAKKMEEMQSSMEMESMQENLGDLRAILHNLLKLSFDQETLMNEFSAVNQSDPRFVELSQQQLKLKDDSQIVQDSLLALSQRVFQIASFVTREVNDMTSHMDKSLQAIKDRKKPNAVAEQQFTMTSMNNLALLLNDVLEQMQNAMADAMGKPQKKKGNQSTPSLSELQKGLNDKIQELKESGMEGRQLSEELAKLAAEQERIRQALKEAQEKSGMNENGQLPGQGLIEKMEETETDLVNKSITQQTIQRQKEILTRLLEAEDAMRERDLDEERKAETAREYEKQVPKAFEEYFKLKEQEIELLKTIPPKLYPYYKNEVNEYFRRIGSETNNKTSE